MTGLLSDLQMVPWTGRLQYHLCLGLITTSSVGTSFNFKISFFMQNHIFISLPIPGIYLFPLRFLKVILISNVYTLYVNYILCFHSDMNAQEKVKIWKNVIRFFFSACYSFKIVLKQSHILIFLFMTRSLLDSFYPWI